MIKDENDFIMHIVGRNKRAYKKYHIYCNKCGADRGYMLKSQDIRPTCNKCAKLGSHVSDEVKKKMSLGAKNRKPRQQKTTDGRSIRDKTTYKGKPKVITDQHKKIAHSMRSLLNQKLKQRSITKSFNRTFTLLGYTIEEFIKHMESKWQPGMSWDNYGLWEIDHVIPDSWFQYETWNDPGFQQSWILDNLQPMWKSENHSKGNRYSGTYRVNNTRCYNNNTKDKVFGE